MNRIACFPSKEQHLLFLALPRITGVLNQSNSILRLFEVLILHISLFLFFKKDLIFTFSCFPIAGVLFHSSDFVKFCFLLPCLCQTVVSLKAELQCNKSLCACVHVCEWTYAVPAGQIQCSWLL